MDPAFLIWIPPIDETSLDEGIEPHYEEILPRHQIDPGSNQETPSEEEVEPMLKQRKSLTNFQQQNEEIKSLLSRSPNKKSSESVHEEKVKVPPTESNNKQIETAIIMKASTDNRIAEYYGLSDIQFADDIDEMDEEVRYIDENKAHHNTSSSSSSRDVRLKKY